jgi:hypothetical protein
VHATHSRKKEKKPSSKRDDWAQQLLLTTIEIEDARDEGEAGEVAEAGGQAAQEVVEADGQPPAKQAKEDAEGETPALAQDQGMDTKEEVAKELPGVDKE